MFFVLTNMVSKWFGMLIIPVHVVRVVKAKSSGGLDIRESYEKFEGCIGSQREGDEL